MTKLNRDKCQSVCFCAVYTSTKVRGWGVQGYVPKSENSVYNQTKSTWPGHLGAVFGVRRQKHRCAPLFFNCEKLRTRSPHNILKTENFSGRALWSYAGKIKFTTCGRNTKNHRRQNSTIATRSLRSRRDKQHLEKGNRPHSPGNIPKTSKKKLGNPPSFSSVDPCSAAVGATTIFYLRYL